jgi:hypothetical protein
VQVALKGPHMMIMIVIGIDILMLIMMFVIYSKLDDLSQAIQALAGRKAETDPENDGAPH